MQIDSDIAFWLNPDDATTPLPLPPHLNPDAPQPSRRSLALTPGDYVRIKEGTFESFDGEVKAVDNTSDTLTVAIVIFGRQTDIELESWQLDLVS